MVSSGVGGQRGEREPGGSVSGPGAIEAAVSHRPWPLPEAPWVLFQSWRSLLFAHWPVAPDTLRPLLPDTMELDLHDGAAWLTIAPFMIEGFRLRGLPALPVLSTFPELNLRTYVRVDGRPGVHFFSLDASSSLAVAGARAFFRLAYHRAQMELTESDGRVSFRSRRRGGEATFRASYEPVGESSEAAAGSVEHFLTERYTVFAPLRGGGVLETAIHHRPWRLQRAAAKIEENRLPDAEGVPLPDEPPLLHFSRRQDTLIWAPRRLRP